LFRVERIHREKTRPVSESVDDLPEALKSRVSTATM
jgi:hypothetical protein